VADKSSDRWAEIHLAFETHGRSGVFLGRPAEICICEPGSWHRFTKLGIPFPHFTAAFIGYLEIVGGLLLLSGLLTRLIAIPFVFEMIVAMLSTKITLYLGTSPLPLPPAPPQIGFWAVLHEVRSEYAQILTVVFLLVNGPGKWSLDAVLLRNPRKLEVSEQTSAPKLRDWSPAAGR
jgi:uncharacterized membrane protein YphA (DoxX/SURF4 family)